MLALIEREVVAPGWITKQMFTDIVAISQMTPGPIGINSATYIGYVVTGSVLGSIITTLTVTLPSFLLVLYASHYIRRHRGDRPYSIGRSPFDEQAEFSRLHNKHSYMCGIILPSLFYQNTPDIYNLSCRIGRPHSILILLWTITQLSIFYILNFPCFSE